MAGQNSVDYYLTKVYTIDKELGGKFQEEKKAQITNEFDTIKNLILQSLHQTKSKQEFRDQKSQKFSKGDVEVITLGVEIRDNINNLRRNLKQLEEILKKQYKSPKKYKKEEIQQREQMLNNLKKQVKIVEQVEKGDYMEDSITNVQTITEMKQDLIKNAGNKPQIRTDMNENEKDALKRFEEQDQQLENQLEAINIGLDQWNVKAKKMGEAIDQRDHRLDLVNTQIDKTKKTIDSQNQRLKDVLKKYRAPSKFCLDVTLICMFLGLIGVIFNMVG